MTISDSDALLSFSDSAGFRHLHTLRIDVVDSVSTIYFAQALAARPRDGLTLELMHGYADLKNTLAILRNVPLAALVLKSPNLDDQVLHALRHFVAPITLMGRFRPSQFAELARIPPLQKLVVLSSDFDVTAARQLSLHASLKCIALPLTAYISADCVACLATMPSLREWRLDDTVYTFCPLSTAVAEALAANRSLEKLTIKTHIQPLSSESFQALSKSETLKKLEISVCRGLENVSGLVALEHLHLNGRCPQSPAISQRAAANICGLVKLHSLTVIGAQFAPDALTTLLTRLPAPKLYVKSVPLTDDQLSALINNTALRELTLVDIALTSAQKIALSTHAKLPKLRIVPH